jgi:iron complex transport system substrate-binding protein
LLILSASAQEFTLDIFGNANEDGLIDEEDISYVQGILVAENEKTDLSDANQDGKVDEADLDQIKKIIQGTESEIYYIDAFGNASRVKHPLERIVLVYDNTAEIIRILGAEERVVGVDSEGSSGAIGKYPTYFPQFIQTASIGNRNDCDVEAILKLQPDAIIIGTKTGCPYLEDKLMGSDIDVVYLETWSKGTPSLFTLVEWWL